LLKLFTSSSYAFHPFFPKDNGNKRLSTHEPRPFLPGLISASMTSSRAERVISAFFKYPFSFFQNINVIHGTHTHCVTIEIYRFDWTLFFRIGAL
jgi:hypothetical protein